MAVLGRGGMVYTEKERVKRGEKKKKRGKKKEDPFFLF